MPGALTTTLRNIGDVDRNDFATPSDFDELVGCYHTKGVITVDCEATDGYFDITLPNGTEIAALSWWHLNGFDEPEVF